MRSFYKAAFIALGVIIALLAVAAPLYAQLDQFPPAGDVVEYDPGTKRHYFTSGVGLEVIILNRAEIYVTAAEDGSAKQSIYGNSLSYKEALEGAAEGRGTIFRNPNLGDGRFHYEHDARVGEDADAYKSQILELDTGALNRDAKGDIDSLLFTKRVNTANFFDKYMKDAEIRLKLSDASLPDDVKNCGGTRGGITLGQRDLRWILVTDGDQALWGCGGQIGFPTQGIYLKSNQVKQAENFNVVYKYDGANTLEYVSSDGGDNKDFTFCDTTKGTEANRNILPAFVRGRSCASSEYIDVEPADLAGRSGIYALTVKDTGSDATMEVGAIPADDPSQSPADQVNQAIAGLAADADELETCKSGDGIDRVFGWIICPVVSMILNAVHAAENYIIKMLVVNPLDATDGNVVYELWKSVRNIANILLIVAFLLLVYSQTTSTGLDAYQVKRLAPRLLLATIGIQLSFYLCAFLIDIFNIFGAGVGVLISSILAQQPTATLTTFDNVAIPTILLFGTGALLLRTELFRGLIASIGASSIVGFLFMALLIVGGAFVTILVRQILIILLVIVSPIAMVASLLPNTAQIYKKWLSVLGKALLMYPLIVLLFAGGKVFGVVAGSGGVGATDSFISFFANIVPLIFIPFAFRVAGGLLARIGDFATKRGEGLRRATTDRQSSFLRGLNEHDDEARAKYLGRRAQRMVSKKPGRIGTWARGSAAGQALKSFSASASGRSRLYRRAATQAARFRDTRVATLERRVAEHGWKPAEEWMALRQNGQWVEAQRWFAEYGGTEAGFEAGRKAIEKQGLNPNVLRNYESMRGFVGDEAMGRAAYLQASAHGKLKDIDTQRRVGEGFRAFYGTYDNFDEQAAIEGKHGQGEQPLTFYNDAMASQWEGRVIEAAKAGARKNGYGIDMGVAWDYDENGAKIAGSDRVSLIPGTQLNLETEEGARAYRVIKQGVYAGSDATDKAGIDMIKGSHAMIAGVAGTGGEALSRDSAKLKDTQETATLRAEKAAYVLEGLSSNPEEYVKGARMEYENLRVAAEKGDAAALSTVQLIDRKRAEIQTRREKGENLSDTFGELPPEEMTNPQGGSDTPPGA